MESGNLVVQRKKIKKIALIEPAERVYNIFSYVKMPKLGLPILGGILKRCGYEVEIYVEKITEINWEKIPEYDFVGISSLTQTALESYAVADKISSWGIPVVMGGPHVSFLPDECLEHCNYVVRGEGEKTLPELIDALNQGKDLKSIRGLSFKTENGNIHNPDREQNKDISFSPDFTLVHGYNKYLKKFFTQRLNGGVIPIATSRGCPHSCSFCSVIKMFGRRYRTLNPDQVIEEIKHQVRVTGSKKIFFVDDNFAENKERAKAILRKIIKENLNLDIVAQMKMNAAQDEELLSLMNRANLRYVMVGFESINPKSLDTFNKQQKQEDMIEAIQRLRKHKINIHGMFIVGTDEDDIDIIQKTVTFAIDNKLDTIQLLSIMPLPGTELYESLINNNKLLTNNYSLYNGHYVVNLPDKIKPSLLQREIIQGHKKFFGWGNISKKLLNGQGYRSVKFMLIGRYLSKRINFEEAKHIQFLRKTEEAFYGRRARNSALDQKKNGYAYFKPEY